MEPLQKQNLKDILVYSVCGTSISLIGISWIVMFYQIINHQRQNP